MICTSCQCLNSSEVRCISGPHYAKRVCMDCGRFQGWIKNPQTLERENKVHHMLEYLQADPTVHDLTSWEINFVASINEQLTQGKKLSPKQGETIQHIYSSLGGAE